MTLLKMKKSLEIKRVLDRQEMILSKLDLGELIHFCSGHADLGMHQVYKIISFHGRRDELYDASERGNLLIRLATDAQHYDLVTLLLVSYPLVDPSVQNGYCLRRAVDMKDTRLVQLILSHEKTQVSCQEWYCFKAAVQSNDLNLLDRLCRHASFSIKLFQLTGLKEQAKFLGFLEIYNYFAFSGD